MKNIFRFQSFLVFLILTPLFSLAQPGTGTDHKFYDEAGRFKVKFPGTPQSSYQDIETDLGTVRMYQFMYETETLAFMLAYVDYPADKLAEMDKSEMLKNAKTGFCDNLKLDIQSEGSISINGYPGVWFDAYDGVSYYAVMRDYIVNNRLYQVGILSSEEISEGLKTRFLNSFELTGY